MAPVRSGWKGALDFGGFSIHMRAFPLIRSRSADSFKNLCPCHNKPVVAPKTCAVDGTQIDSSLCGKGVMVGKVVHALSEDTIEALAKGERTDVIRILDLAPRASVSLHLAIKHFRFVPDKDVAGSEGPVGILWNGLMGADRVLVSEWIPRSGSRNELLALTADVHGLTGVVLPYATDLNEVPEHAFTVDANAAAMFEAFAKQQGIAMDDFSHSKYEDEYGKRRKAAIDAALAGAPIPVSAKAPAAKAVPDLMAAMSAALDASKAPAKKKPAAKKASAKAVKA